MKIEEEFDKVKYLSLLKEYVTEIRRYKQKYKLTEIGVGLNSPNMIYFLMFLPCIEKLCKIKIILVDEN